MHAACCPLHTLQLDCSACAATLNPLEPTSISVIIAKFLMTRILPIPLLSSRLLEMPRGISARGVARQMLAFAAVLIVELRGVVPADCLGLQRAAPGVERVIDDHAVLQHFMVIRE